MKEETKRLTLIILMCVCMFVSGLLFGKFVLSYFGFNEPKIVEKIVEVEIPMIVEVFVDIDLVNELNQLYVPLWSLTGRLDWTYNLIVIIDDNFSTSVHDVTIEEIQSHIEYVKELQEKIEWVKKILNV